MKLINSPIERTTAITNVLLAVVAFGGIFFLYLPAVNRGSPWKVAIWSGAIGLIGLSAALGSVAHGFSLRPSTHHRLWQGLNMTLALTVSLFVTGVIYDLWGPADALRSLPIVLALSVAFYLATLLLSGLFFIFIVFESLALLFALGGYITLAIQGELDGAWFMATGVLISIIAAAMQATKSLTVTLIWQFDHNSIFHLVQTVGLMFLLAGLRWSLSV